MQEFLMFDLAYRPLVRSMRKLRFYTLSRLVTSNGSSTKTCQGAKNLPPQREGTGLFSMKKPHTLRMWGSCVSFCDLRLKAVSPTQQIPHRLIHCSIHEPNGHRPICIFPDDIRPAVSIHNPHLDNLSFQGCSWRNGQLSEEGE